MNTQNNNNNSEEQFLFNETEMINNSLEIQNKLIEPASMIYDSINRDIPLANFDKSQFEELINRNGFNRQIKSIMMMLPFYNANKTLEWYKLNNIDHRQYFLSVATGGQRGFNRKLTKTDIRDVNMRQNEINSPEIKPIFGRKNDYRE